MNKRDKMLEAFLDIENEKINFKTTMDILNNYIIVYSVLNRTPIPFSIER